MKPENLFESDCIRTSSGIYVNVFEPTPDMISIEDIAHSLSHQCRFGGHLPEFYSVAEHSVYVARLVRPEQRLAALLHDASEAYLLDIPSPIKARLANYKEIEDGLMKVIADRFGFEYPFHEDVKLADQMALNNEWHSLMINDGKRLSFFQGLSMNQAKKEFLEYFNKIVNI